MSADPLAPVRRQLRDELRQRVDARGLVSAPRTQRRVLVRDEALALLRQSGAILPQRELTRMVNEVSDDVVGFGPIEFLLQDPEVTEVMARSDPSAPELGAVPIPPQGKRSDGAGSFKRIQGGHECSGRHLHAHLEGCLG
jgi:hypothetical protein